MIRISLTGLALSLFLMAGAATPAVSESFQSNNQPTACDCSNCSAQHCQGTGGGRMKWGDVVLKRG